jgi:WhiB family transcriptional regulator, redox-sensing transcriptional regulator
MKGPNGNSAVMRLKTKERRKDWRADAKCRETGDPELYFPVGHSNADLKQIDKAKTVCKRCPVSAACLDWAISTGQDHGIWGGKTEIERRADKRNNEIVRVGTW